MLLLAGWDHAVRILVAPSHLSVLLVGTRVLELAVVEWAVGPLVTDLVALPINRAIVLLLYWMLELAIIESTVWPLVTDLVSAVESVPFFLSLRMLVHTVFECAVGQAEAPFIFLLGLHDLELIE